MTRKRRDWSKAHTFSTRGICLREEKKQIVEIWLVSEKIRREKVGSGPAEYYYGLQ
jgi:hypothetical protein